MSVVHRLLKEWEKNQTRPSSSKGTKKRMKNKKKTSTKAERLSRSQPKRRPKKNWDFTSQDLTKHKLSVTEQLNKKARLRSKHREKGPVLVKEARKTFANKSRVEKQNKKERLHKKWEKRLSKKKMKKKSRSESNEEDRENQRNYEDKDDTTDELEKNYRTLQRSHHQQEQYEEEQERVAAVTAQQNESPIRRSGGDVPRDTGRTMNGQPFSVPTGANRPDRNSSTTLEGSWDWSVNTSSGMDYLDDKLDSLQKEFHIFENKVKEKLKPPHEQQQLSENDPAPNIEAFKSIGTSLYENFYGNEKNVASTMRINGEDNENWKETCHELLTLQQGRIGSLTTQMNFMNDKIQNLVNQMERLQKQNPQNQQKESIQSNYTRRSSIIRGSGSQNNYQAISTNPLTNQPPYSASTTSATIGVPLENNNNLDNKTHNNYLNIGNTSFPLSSTGVSSSAFDASEDCLKINGIPSILNQYSKYSTPTSLDNMLFVPSSSSHTGYTPFESTCTSSRLPDYSTENYISTGDKYMPSSSACLGKPNDLLNRTFIPSDPLIFNYKNYESEKTEKMYQKIMSETNQNTQALSSTLTSRKFQDYQNRNMTRSTNKGHFSIPTVSGEHVPTVGLSTESYRI